jgi:putative transposase
MAESDRLGGGIGWIDLVSVERERTPEQIVEVGIQLHLAGPSLSGTKQYLERVGVERSRTAIHNWVQKADLQPTGDGAPNQIAVDETVIGINDERNRLYAAVGPGTNGFLHLRLSQTRTTHHPVPFLRELRDKQQVERSTFLVDGAHYPKVALERLGLRLRIARHGDRNAVERVFREVGRGTGSFSDTFSNVEPPTAGSWLQAFAVWRNRC